MPTDQRPSFPFVVGCNRSGTTLLRAMLDSHPDLAMPPEAYFTVPALRFDAAEPFDAGALLERVEANGSFINWRLPPDALDPLRGRPFTSPGDLIREVYAAYARTHEKPRAGDKTPRNVLHIALIAGALPESRFVHLVRDGRDVVPSVREHLLGPVSLPAAIDYWRARVTAGRKAGGRLGPERYLEIRYEDLVVNPEHVLRTVCDFVGIEYTDAMLSYPKRSDEITAGTWDSRSHRGVAQPPTTGRRDWRTAMARADVQLFDALAGDLLDELGYGRSDLPASPTARARAGVWRASRPLRRAARPLTSRLDRRRRRRERRIRGQIPRHQAPGSPTSDDLPSLSS